MTVTDSGAVRASPRMSAGRQVKATWLVLGAATLVFVLLAAVAVAGARFYYGHATVKEPARLEVISGSGALVRRSDMDEWRLITDETTIREGDEISTALGTVVWLTMFDGSTVEVAEDTVVRVARMRSSRFLKSTRHFILEPARGTVYVGVAPHGDYDYIEFTVRHGSTDVTMADEPGRDEAGSFLVEVLRALPEDANEPTRVRAAVLRGAATLGTSATARVLHANEQAIVDPQGGIGPVTEAVRELIQNGSFEHGLAGWVEFQQQSQRTTGVVASGASVEFVQDGPEGGDPTSLEFIRGTAHDDNAQIGVRQRIGQTLRVYSSLLLEFDVKISSQRPVGGGVEGTEFPFIVRMNYIDVQGQEREWWHGYYVLDDPERPVSSDRATQLDMDRWQHVVFDLRSLSPLPRQITSIVVYASGHSYQTRVAHISLTSGELDGASS
jgi:hypothetical protein